MRKKILLNYIIILIISALSTGALAFYFINNSYTNSKEEKLLTNLLLIQHSLEKTYENIDDVNFFHLSQQLSRDINSRVTFIDKEGFPIADSINNSIIFQSQKNTDDFKSALKGQKKIVKKYSEEAGTKYFYLSLYPIKIGNKNVLIRLGDSYDQVDNIIEEFLFYFLIANVISVFFAIIIAYMTSGKIVKPIKQLTASSRLIAGGNFKSKIHVNSKDEIEELSNTFNDMASELEAIIFKIKSKNVQMNSILSSIQEGILALDLHNKVFLLNESVNRILDNEVNVVKGQYIDEILQNIQEIYEIKEKISRKEDYYGEIKLESKKIISLYTYPIIDNIERIGTLIVIRDITALRNLEKMRKDFVANVSHELRTPLTSIAGFVETLKTKELDVENKNKALDIIEMETEKLKKMINELLKLSKIESIEKTESVSIFDLKKEISEILILLEPQIMKKNIDIKLDISDDISSIKGHRELFRLIFMNLIENAIKYNKEKGEVNIFVCNFENGIKLIVEDNGIGISEENLPWIFGRFYRVKNKDTNTPKGTGLGLSIVEETINYLGGTIKITSKLEQGTRVEIIVPE